MKLHKSLSNKFNGMNHILVVSLTPAKGWQIHEFSLWEDINLLVSAASFHFSTRGRILFYCYTARARIGSYVFFGAAAATVCRRLYFCNRYLPRKALRELSSELRITQPTMPRNWQNTKNIRSCLWWRCLVRSSFASLPLLFPTMYSHCHTCNSILWGVVSLTHHTARCLIRCRVGRSMRRTNYIKLCWVGWGRQIEEFLSPLRCRRRRMSDCLPASPIPGTGRFRMWNLIRTLGTGPSCSSFPHTSYTSRPFVALFTTTAEF